MNYFELLELNLEYDLSKNLLTNQYLQKQVLYHPDKARNENQRKEYLEKSIKLNEAYEILKDDYMRAEYLLKLNGQEFNDEILKNKLTSKDLEEIMESHEMLLEMQSLEELKEFQQQKISEKITLIQEITSSFNANNIPKALDLTIKLKYLTNLVGNIKLKIKDANSRNF